MSKMDIAKECEELIYRFKRLKKALDEESDSKYSPAQQAAIEAARQISIPRDLNLPKPQTKEQLLRKAKDAAEKMQAQQLANTLKSKGILGGNRAMRQPTSEDLRMWAESNGFHTEESLKKDEAAWGTNVFNDWMAEATKPINARFNSPQEEQAYWNSIKIEDK